MVTRSLRTDIRLVALLSLAFAQHASRVCRLTDDTVAERDGVLTLTFAKDPVDMPAALVEVITDQLRKARTNPKSLRADGKRWLFPGQNFGTHITPDAVQRSVVAIGIKTRNSRNAALMSLAAELQAGIIASAFGLHVNTAVVWAESAGGSFNAHVARRADDAHGQAQKIATRRTDRNRTKTSSKTNGRRSPAHRP